MYDREKIDQLFTLFCETRETKYFEQLVTECRPMVEVILSKYSAFRPWFEDICQDVLLKIWTNLNNPDQLKRHLGHPINFLYMRIWPYIYYSLEAYARSNGIPMELSDKERLIVRLREEGEMSYDLIGEALELESSTIRCFYSIAKQKRDRLVQIDIGDPRATGETRSDFLDPAKQYEVREVRKDWCSGVIDRLSSHPFYKSHPRLLKKVKRLLEETMKESSIDEEG